MTMNGENQNENSSRKQKLDSKTYKKLFENV